MKFDFEVDKKDMKKAIAEAYVDKMSKTSMYLFGRRSEVEKRAKKLIDDGYIDNSIKQELHKQLENADFKELFKEMLKDKIEEDYDER